MKKLLRLSVYLFLIILVVATSVVALLFVPAVQMAVVKQLLPEDSQIGEVRLTPGSVRMANLRLKMESGDVLNVGSLDARMRPMKWLTSRTVWVDTLRAWNVDLERAAPIEVAELEEAIEEEIDEAIEEAEGKALESLVAVLRELEATRLRLHIDEIAMQGLVDDPAVGVVRYELQVNGLTPGGEGFIRLAGTRPAQRQTETLDLPQIAYDVRAHYRQSSAGGPEAVRVEAAAQGFDERNQRFMAIAVDTKIDFNTAAQTITASNEIDFSLDQPKLLSPQLDGLDPVALESRLSLEVTDRDRIRLESGQTRLAIGDNVELRADLAQSFELDLGAFPTGPILSAHLRVSDPAQLPLGGDAWELTEAGPLTLRLNLDGGEEGDLLFAVTDFLVGPLSVQQEDERVVRQLTAMAETIDGRLNPDGRIDLQIPAVVVSLNNREAASVRAQISGNVVEGQFDLDAEANADFAVWLDEQYFRERLPVSADRLGKLSASVRGSSSLPLLKVEALNLRMTDAADEGIFSAEAQQPFSINTETGAIDFADAEADLVRVRLAGLPSELIRPFLPEGLGLRYREIGGLFALAGGQNAVEFRTVEALQLEGLHLDHNGQSYLANARVAVGGSAAFSQESWTIADLNTTLADGGGELLKFAVDASGPSTEWVPDAEGAAFSMTSEGDLARLSRQPPFSGFLAPLRSGSFSLRGSSPGLDQSVDLELHLRNLQAASTSREPVFNLRMESSVTTPLAESAHVRGNLNLASSREPGVTDRWTMDMTLREMTEAREVRGSLEANQIRLSELQSLAALLEQTDAPAPATRTEPSRTTRAGRPSVVAYEAPPWEGLLGHLSLKAERVVMADGTRGGPIRGEITITEDRLALDPFELHLEEGLLKGKFVAHSDAGAGLNSLRTTGELRGIRPSTLMKDDKRWRGTVDGHWELQGSGPTFEVATERLAGEIRMHGEAGKITALNLETPVGGAARVGLALLGGQGAQPGIAALAQVIPHFNEIPYDQIELRLRRAENGEIELQNLELSGPALHLRGDGRIAPGSWQEMVSQPMMFSLEFGARGDLANQLGILGLMQNEINQDGFRMGSSKLQIGGSLSNPDASSVQQLLTRAALAAVGRRPAESTRTDADNQKEAPSEDKAPSQEKAPRSDLDRGLDLLEGLLRRR